jgi:uncharacterized membrane protein
MIRRDALSEYVRASLWVLPTLSVVAALAVGALLSAVSIGVHSPLAFQGTPDDARNLLIGISGTMVTVIALLLGLTTLAWIWPVSRVSDGSAGSSGDPGADLRRFAPVLEKWVRIGFERTLEQDAAFGIRQLVDAACKALSPAVNDPYTAVQAIDHLSVIFCALARRPLGDHVARQPSGAAVIVPGRRFPEYLAVMCGLIRRYGASEPTVASALLRLLAACADVADGDPEICTAIEEQAGIIVADTEREVPQPADLVPVHAEAETMRQAVLRQRPRAL